MSELQKLVNMQQPSHNGTSAADAAKTQQQQQVRANAMQHAIFELQIYNEYAISFSLLQFNVFY